MTPSTDDFQKMMDAAGGPFAVKNGSEVATIVRGDGSEVAFYVFGNFGIGEKSKAAITLLAMSHDLAAELLTARAKIAAGSWLATEIRGHIIILEHCGQTDTVTCRELKRFLAAYEAAQ